MSLGDAAERHLQLILGTWVPLRIGAGELGSNGAEVETLMSQWARTGVIGIARRRKPTAETIQRPLVMQPRGLGADYVLLDAHAFRNAMNVLIARRHSSFTTLVIRPERPGATLALGETILHQLRGASGDLVGYLEAAIGVALHATDHVGAVAFSDRLRDEWRRYGRGELMIDIAEHPFAEQRVIELLTADWSATAWMPLIIDDGDSLGDQPRRGGEDERRTGVADRQ
jgi:hypothetical protein